MARKKNAGNKGLEPLYITDEDGVVEVKQGNCYLCYDVGDRVLVQTPTFFYTGELLGIRFPFIYMLTCSWVADTGKFHVFLQEGSATEVEPYPQEEIVCVNIECIMAVSRWNPPTLPKKNKS